jgi:hypothetical protein
MAKVEIPPGSGNFYRYEYDEPSGKTVYKGPIGSAPAIEEEHFAKRVKTMFGEARWKKYKDIISLETEEKAENAVKKLTKEWKAAKSDSKRNRIIWAANNAANRADVIRDNVKGQDTEARDRRAELSRIEGIYRNFVNTYRKGD